MSDVLYAWFGLMSGLVVLALVGLKLARHRWKRGYDEMAERHSRQLERVSRDLDRAIPGGDRDA